MTKPVFSLQDIVVTVGDNVKILDHLNFDIYDGDFITVLGTNGAGKSTLIKVLTGVYTKDEGEIFIKGKEKAISIHSPQEAQKLGISTVYQEITLCPNLSVAENMYIGRESSALTNWKKMNADADKILKNLDIPAKATQQLASCSIAVQQMVAIARAVDMNCKVLILDEPTNHLDMESITALNNGLIKFPGVALFSCHDHQFVETTANRIMEILPNGTLIDKITTYDEYLASDEMARKRTVYTKQDEDEEDN